MTLQFFGKDPESGADNCPAVFVDQESGDLLLQGGTVTDPATLAEAGGYSPLADHESLIRLPARMRQMILEALNGEGAAVQRADRGDDALGGASREQGRLFTV
jgi:hypothetical protein